MQVRIVKNFAEAALVKAQGNIWEYWSCSLLQVSEPNLKKKDF